MSGPTSMPPLDAEEASELARLLGLLQDWLLHTDQHVLDDLAGFGVRGSPASAKVRGLINELGCWSLRLHRLAGGARR